MLITGVVWETNMVWIMRWKKPTARSLDKATDLQWEEWETEEGRETDSWAEVPGNQSHSWVFNFVFLFWRPEQDTSFSELNALMETVTEAKQTLYNREITLSVNQTEKVC